MVNKKGIEANLDKIKASLEMRSLAFIKNVQCLNGRITAFSTFASKSATKCLPFFKILQKPFQWRPDVEEAFQNLKAYLPAPPLLSMPCQEKSYTYISLPPCL